MKRILVVDDDEGILGAINMVLEDAGYYVEMAAKEEDVFKKIIKFKPHLVILDMLLSGSDGRDIGRKIKGSSNSHAIPIIMTSAHPNAKNEITNDVANDFLPKPFEMDELTQKVIKYIGEA